MLTSSARYPRWLEARAARLGAAVVESVLEVHGHARLLERLADARFGRALAAALALPDENDLGAVARVLQRGLSNDERRLGVVVDPAAGVVSLEDGTLTPLFCVDGERVVRLGARRAVVDVERRLGAALLLAHASRPGVSEPLPLDHRAPGRSARERLALALLADLVASDDAPPELLRLAFGSAAGEPFGVPLLVYDDVLRSLERMLHGPSPRRGASRFRLAPLVALYDELSRAEPYASRQPVARFVRRQQRFALDLDTRALDDDTPARPLPRRPTRSTRRTLSWRPPVLRPTRGLGQRDLFAP